MNIAFLTTFTTKQMVVSDLDIMGGAIRALDYYEEKKEGEK